MIKFICDKCGIESDNVIESKNNGEYIPNYWLTISNSTIQNEISNRALIYAGNVQAMHFCSKRCFVSYFFKEEKKDRNVDNVN